MSRHRGGIQAASRAVFCDIPNPPLELQELRLKLREVLAKFGYCMAAALESIADEAEVSAVQAVCEHVLLPDPPVTS